MQEANQEYDAICRRRKYPRNEIITVKRRKQWLAFRVDEGTHPAVAQMCVSTNQIHTCSSHSAPCLRHSHLAVSISEESHTCNLLEVRFRAGASGSKLTANRFSAVLPILCPALPEPPILPESTPKRQAWRHRILSIHILSSISIATCDKNA